MPNVVASAAEAVSSISSGDDLWIHSMAATPRLLVDAYGMSPSYNYIWKALKP
jgi:hypothetical protein